MKKHIIDPIQEHNLNLEKTIASSSGLNGSKSLVVSFNSGTYSFVVTKNKKTIYNGHSSGKAVDVYNSIKSRTQKNTSTLEPFQESDLEFSRELASSHGCSASKKLNLVIINCTFNYEVINKKEVIY